MIVKWCMLASFILGFANLHKNLLGAVMVPCKVQSSKFTIRTVLVLVL